MKDVKIVGLLVAFLALCHLVVLGQREEKSIEHLDNSTVIIQNTLPVNTPNLEFSPAFYQNGIVFVKAYDSNKKIDSNLGIPFFELFYAELNGQGMPGAPQSFSSKVNSVSHEGPLAFNFSENLVYYTSNSKNQNAFGKFTMKIYEARKGEEDWENITELPFNGDSFYTMHPSITIRGDRLYFASNRPGGYGNMDLYYVEKAGNTWGEPINLGPTINTPKNEAFPFIHASGMLFFSSEGHGGLGGYDIFAVNTRIEQENEIFHLSAPINSPKADLGLVLNPTGTQGYFSSARLGGMGQDDIYMLDAPKGLFEKIVTPKRKTIIVTLAESDKTMIPEAGVYIFEKNESGLFGEEDLYEVIVTAKEETSNEMEVQFVRKKELGPPHFYTNKQGLFVTELIDNKDYLILVTKKGFADKELQYATYDQPSSIVKVPLKRKSCTSITGMVTNQLTQEVVTEAKIFIKSKCSGITQLINTNATGQFNHCLAFGCDYLISAESKGFIISTIAVSTASLDPSELKTDISLVPLKSSNILAVDNLSVGATMVLENIYYDFNKSAIRSGAAAELDALFNLMNQYPSMHIELIAHTDARGPAIYNQKLSNARAIAAKSYLTNKGIATNRIVAIGMGERKIRNHCWNDVNCSDQAHRYNRRTEVRITKISENVGVFYNE